MKLTNEIKVVAVVLAVFLLSHFVHWYFLSRATVRANRTIAQLTTERDYLKDLLRPKCPGDSTGR